MININYYFYINNKVFNTKYPYGVKLNEYVFIHNSEYDDGYKLIEYDKFMIDRMIKIYKITKHKKLKKLYDFIYFCDENMLSLEDIIKKY